MRYCVVIEERKTIIRWASVDALSSDEARDIVEKTDWRTYEEAGTDTHSQIVDVYEADPQP